MSVIVCSKCSREIGQVDQIDGKEYLIINGLAVNVLRGVCIYCGAEFHWSISERMLAELIQRVMQLRNGV
ncbi:hypothetical protein C4588_04125 [Candidatus Parcubacteria bacterium]|nr:MAG: hypothetical protein C4588_04125 [Candidatus Parcubacteria bacterium]